jgi:hypothetical protein
LNIVLDGVVFAAGNVVNGNNKQVGQNAYRRMSLRRLSIWNAP